MSFQLKGYDYTESVANLADPDDLPVRYTQMMTVGVLYPPEVKRVLMIGLGGGSISSYLGRYMPDATIDTVEVDPGVITAAKKYFGMIETPRVRYLEGDGRVFLNRRKETYDLILVDAFHGGYVPFHLLTRSSTRWSSSASRPAALPRSTCTTAPSSMPRRSLTLRAVFPGVHLYPSGQGEMITVATAEPAARWRDAREPRQVAAGEDRFRFPLPALLARRTEKSGAHADRRTAHRRFRAGLYDTIGESERRSGHSGRAKRGRNRTQAGIQPVVARFRARRCSAPECSYSFAGTVRR